jgi:uncharacterized protein
MAKCTKYPNEYCSRHTAADRTLATTFTKVLVSGALLAAFCGCGDGSEGPQGPAGPTGGSGDTGAPGNPGQNGADGAPGVNGKSCPIVSGSISGQVEGVPAAAPLSAVVALSFCDLANTNATNIPEYVKELVTKYGTNSLPASFEFPLPPATTDTVRAIQGLFPNVVVKWMDPIGWDNMSTSTVTPRFGANADYIAYFGDGLTAADTPYWNGKDGSGWMWVNHEYVSNGRPKATAAPTGQHLTLARFLNYWGTITGSPTSNTWTNGDLVVYTDEYKKQVGGTWMHVVRDPATGTWAVDRSATYPARRYDATDATLVKVVGQTVGADTDDNGVALPANVVTGIQGNCSGGVTPWGTIFTGEENVQDSYGDLETAWTAAQKFQTGANFDPGSNVTFDTTPSTTNEFGIGATASHPKDAHGFLVEIDPGLAPGEYYGKTTAGVGHRKLGAMGRARWENATFAMGSDWKLIPNQPIVLYAGNDRRSGHIYKFVSSANYTVGMTKAQTRALLDDGKVYVAHFAGLDTTTGRTLVATQATPTEAAPGTGQWLELSTTSTAIAPNATALGTATKTVGQALTDVSWNGIGGFPTDGDVKKALFTASLKIGAMELNRPEDLEYNPIGTPRIYVAFTNHTGGTALTQNGVLVATQPNRADPRGGVYVMEETTTATPAASMTFKYWQAWAGDSNAGLFTATCPDNIMIDDKGGVWFGTDGNFNAQAKKSADALYYLDLNPAHKTTATPTYGLAFRVVAVPSDAEITGPAFSSKMSTLFFSVQHPGEDVTSNWPPR